MQKNSLEQNRNITLHFLVTEEESAQIHERAASVGIVNLSAYLRRMAIDGLVVYLDLSEISDLVSLLRRCSNNLNQIAKRANETHSIYETDIEDLRRQYDTLWDAANKIMQNLAKIKV